MYPEVGLAEARQKALEARKLVREGSDPVLERHRQRAAQAFNAETFQAIAEEWLAARAGEWSPTYEEAIRSALTANLSTAARFQAIGAAQKSAMAGDRKGPNRGLSPLWSDVTSV